MRLTILGSGTAAPLLERSCASYLVEANNHKLLFDSGAGTIRRLLEVKANLFDIEHIFYTHLHNDHINDLGAIIWSNNYGGIRKKPLNLYGPAGFKAYFDILLNRLLKPAKLNFKISVKELKNSKLKISPVSISTFPIRHSSTTKSVAYRILHNDRSLAYLGDTGCNSEAISAAKNADFLLVECSVPKEAEGHLTPASAGRIAAKASVKNLILTHFYPEVLKTGIKKECAKEFAGKIILARDKVRLNI
jgi:ribonuclease BN (tRNA processing enzyme)